MRLQTIANFPGEPSEPPNDPGDHDPNLPLAGSGWGRVRLHLGCALRALRRGEWHKLGYYGEGILRELRKCVSDLWA